MGLIQFASNYKKKLVKDFKEGRKEKEELRALEKAAYKESYRKERVKTARKEAAADAKAGGKIKRILGGLMSKANTRATKVSVGQYNPWTDTVKANKNNPWR